MYEEHLALAKTLISNNAEPIEYGFIGNIPNDPIKRFALFHWNNMRLMYDFIFKSEGDIQAEELQNYIKNNGIESAIVKYTGVEKGSHMFNVILDEWNKI